MLFVRYFVRVQPGANAELMTKQATKPVNGFSLGSATKEKSSRWQEKANTGQTHLALDKLTTYEGTSTIIIICAEVCGVGCAQDRPCHYCFLVMTVTSPKATPSSRQT